MVSYHKNYLYIDPGPVSNVTVSNQPVTSSKLIIQWMPVSITSSTFRHYAVIYSPVRGPYGPIITSNRRKRQSAQAGELTMTFTGTNGTLTNLSGAVAYRIQVAVVVLLNGQEVTGDRSAPIEMTTLEGGEQIFCTNKTCVAMCIPCVHVKIVTIWVSK